MVSSAGRTEWGWATMKRCNHEAIVEAFNLIVGDGHVTELRALEATMSGSSWPVTLVGYFDNGEALAKAVGTIRSAKGIYFTPNPISPELLARAANRIK